MRLGIYCGSFNPVHKGHIEIVNSLINNDIVDKVLIVPTLEYWDKTNLVSLEHRINMLKFYSNENIIIEEEFNGTKYTSDLLKLIESKYKDDIYLIIGADNIINFDKWHNYKEVLKYNLIIVNRNNINVNNYLNKLNKKDKYYIVNIDNYNDCSSTFIRDNLDCGYLDEEVYNYIVKNELYK